jgi:hypothetical protein
VLTLAGGVDDPGTTPKTGDVNGDGEINVIDAVMTLKHIVGTAPLDAAQSARADMNGDGSVDVADAVLILKTAVGLPVTP